VDIDEWRMNKGGRDASMNRRFKFGNPGYRRGTAISEKHLERAMLKGRSGV